MTEQGATHIAETAAPWDGLNPPYRTLVVDPPWLYKPTGNAAHERGGAWSGYEVGNPPPYSMMTVAEIAAMPVGDLAADGAHLYLWTTNRHLPAAFEVAKAWGFRYAQTLTWCKVPMGRGLGGAFVNTTEFVLFCRRGHLAHQTRIETTWWQWKRAGHSVKPQGFMDVVEQVSPGPYVELFARAPRLGWDAWGYGYEVAS